MSRDTYQSKYDPGRKKPMAVLKLLENDPGVVPCAFSEELEKKDLVEVDDMVYIRSDEEARKAYGLLVESFLARGEDPPTVGQRLCLIKPVCPKSRLRA